MLGLCQTCHAKRRDMGKGHSCSCVGGKLSELLSNYILSAVINPEILPRHEHLYTKTSLHHEAMWVGLMESNSEKAVSAHTAETHLLQDPQFPWAVAELDPLHASTPLPLSNPLTDIFENMIFAYRAERSPGTPCTPLLKSQRGSTPSHHFCRDLEMSWHSC